MQSKVAYILDQFPELSSDVKMYILQRRLYSVKGILWTGSGASREREEFIADTLAKFRDTGMDRLLEKYRKMTTDLVEEKSEWTYNVDDLLAPFATQDSDTVKSYQNSLLLVRSLAKYNLKILQDKYSFGHYDPNKLRPEFAALLVIGQMYGIEAVATLWQNRLSPKASLEIKHIVNGIWGRNGKEFRAIIEEILPSEIQKAAEWLEGLEKRKESEFLAEKIPIAQKRLHLLKGSQGKFIEERPEETE